jgi:hypothetical protein
MKNRLDNRGENVKRIQENINNTVRNLQRADETIEKSSDDTMKEKNERKDGALQGMRGKIRDEAIALEKGYRL